MIVSPLFDLPFALRWIWGWRCDSFDPEKLDKNFSNENDPLSDVTFVSITGTSTEWEYNVSAQQQDKYLLDYVISDLWFYQTKLFGGNWIYISWTKNRM